MWALTWGRARSCLLTVPQPGCPLTLSQNCFIFIQKPPSISSPLAFLKPQVTSKPRIQWPLFPMHILLAWGVACTTLWNPSSLVSLTWQLFCLSLFCSEYSFSSYYTGWNSNLSSVSQRYHSFLQLQLLIQGSMFQKCILEYISSLEC